LKASPFFSVIIPSYNRCEFLNQTIESVLSQTFKDFEILVIDDGSTDGTYEKIKLLIEKDNRVKYFYKTNEERGAARNFGIKNSSGKYIVFLDSDDLFKLNHLENLFNLTSSYKNLNFFACKFDFIEDGNQFNAPISFLNEGVHDYKILLKGNPFACNICIKKNNPALNLFPEERKYAGMEDWLFLFSNLWSQDLYLSGITSSTMIEHANRSMRFNQLISERRENATKYILNHFNLIKSEKKHLKGYSYYFCSIHSYLDRERRKSLKFLMKAIINLGIKIELVQLGVKIIFGKKIIGKIKEVISHK
jgi:glycosyltransferase involved in cell wall biosynthesis